MSKEKASSKSENKNESAVVHAIAAIEQRFGKGTLMRLGSMNSFVDRKDVLSTGCPSLNMALGVGGLPRGRIVEIYGPEASGKTTLTLQMIASAQKAGGEVAFIDAEHALDPKYAEAIGVDINSLLINQPDCGEQALEIVNHLVMCGGVSLIVVDSVAALTPKAELEGNMGDQHVGLQARLMSQALRKLTSSISRSNCIVIFINQLRTKIGVMFGNPETTTGGNALKFYSSVRLDIRRIAALKNAEGEVSGNRCRIKVVKNKVAPPFRETEVDIIYGKGISREGDVLDLAVQKKILTKGGSWFSYGDQKLGQGRENVRELLAANPELMNELEQKISGRSQIT